MTASLSSLPNITWGGRGLWIRKADHVGMKQIFMLLSLVWNLRKKLLYNWARHVSVDLYLPAELGCTPDQYLNLHRVETETAAWNCISLNTVTSRELCMCMELLERTEIACAVLIYIFEQAGLPSERGLTDFYNITLNNCFKSDRHCIK